MQSLCFATYDKPYILVTINTLSGGTGQYEYIKLHYGIINSSEFVEDLPDNHSSDIPYYECPHCSYGRYSTRLTKYKKRFPERRFVYVPGRKDMQLILQGENYE